jgi:hypothetical protein
MNPSSNIRKFLSGTLRTHLLDLLAEAKKSDVEIYAALYELGDPELVATLKQIGAKCSLVLGSGLCWPPLNPTQVLMNPFGASPFGPRTSRSIANPRQPAIGLSVIHAMVAISQLA